MWGAAGYGHLKRDARKAQNKNLCNLLIMSEYTKMGCELIQNSSPRCFLLEILYQVVYSHCSLSSCRTVASVSI